MTPPPLIGIGCDTFRDANSDQLGAIVGVRRRYADAVQRAGGIPLLMPHLDDPAAIAHFLHAVSGFVMVGGDDLTQGREPPPPSVKPLAADRLRTDMQLLDALLQRRMPTLAICLGCQQLNVLRGGTIYLDLPTEGPPDALRHNGVSGRPGRYHAVRHVLHIEPDSLLSRLWAGATEVEVNSCHHQAVRDVGRGLKAVARSSDGIVEALEPLDQPFFLAVQWHPELDLDDPLQHKLFEALVAEALK